MMATQLKVGDRLQAVTHEVTEDKMVEFEKVVWDRGRNSHSDINVAKADGIQRTIASGQNQMAFLHEMIERNFGDAWVYGGKISARYIHPVYADDDLTPNGLVTEIAEVDGKPRVTLQVWCENQNGRKTSAGTASAGQPVGRAQLDRRRQAGSGMTAGALEGVRVIELTHAWAGPYCGMMLGDMGAEVIKIENPRQKTEARGGYPYVGNESVLFMMLHRNKKSVTLDLKNPASRQICFDLVKSADILIQNFRPGLMKKLGLTYKH